MLVREGRRHILIAAQKPADATEAAAHEPRLHPAFEPKPTTTRRVRADRRTVRPTATPIANI